MFILYAKMLNKHIFVISFVKHSQHTQYMLFCFKLSAPTDNVLDPPLTFIKSRLWLYIFDSRTKLVDVYRFRILHAVGKQLLRTSTVRIFPDAAASCSVHLF